MILYIKKRFFFEIPVMDNIALLYLNFEIFATDSYYKWCSLNNKGSVITITLYILLYIY